MKTVAVITLGCSKNRVDTEYVISGIKQEGFVITNDIEKADWIFINTCSFIEDARIESIDTILQISENKKEFQTVCVAGCLPSRYGQELKDGFPEVDVFAGCGNLDKVIEMMRSGHGYAVTRSDSWIPDKFIRRESSLSPYTGFLKISEGCSRKCAFCAIPSIRGPQKSISPDIIVSEAESLLSQGVKELVVIAQDTTMYGTDKGYSLIDLLQRIDNIDGDFWIRLLYLYPSKSVLEIAKTISTGKHFTPYLDIPLQHTSNSVLKFMKRGYNFSFVNDLFSKLRSDFPEIFLRTTILTGHPGESITDFRELKRFLETFKFNHLGVFPYSPEEGTQGYKLSCPSRKSAIARARSIMELQKNISRDLLAGMKGQKIKVLVEDYDEENMIVTGRHSGQAPETDGLTYLSEGDYLAGSFVNVVVSNTSEYDLIGSLSSNDDINS
ncbi:30S ribosomal protein S12 methylthiotransferase RimO [Myxococcota bacterium]|nr:30S ribosomal protein S12 methylthiotransferase RimO [Myxococcota bacterium]MBU1381486.1 30S ribosomal protein S12 methylthiotransferase RimO [Myxococcota bacterium]MBU1497680.1 30S ribosomal protein S12 methylthiotransferase RimO [Myxococcota bacterium]